MIKDYDPVALPPPDIPLIKEFTEVIDYTAPYAT